MTPIIGIMASANWSSANASSFESIATATGTGSSGTITFSSIPSTFTSLQIRATVKETETSSAYESDIIIRFNGDTGSNYAYHYLRGNGTSVIAAGFATQTLGAVMDILTSSNATIANIQGVGIIDIHNYASTTQNKTMRAFSGADLNGSGGIALSSSLWASTSAITSISLISANASNFTTTTQFALYGIKGA